MAAELNAYISFTLKRRIKLSSKPHEAIEGLFYLVLTKNIANINRKLR